MDARACGRWRRGVVPRGLVLYHARPSVTPCDARYRVSNLARPFRLRECVHSGLLPISREGSLIGLSKGMRPKQ